MVINWRVRELSDLLVAVRIAESQPAREKTY